MFKNLSEGHQKADEPKHTDFFALLSFFPSRKKEDFMKSFLVFYEIQFLKYFEPNKVWCEKLEPETKVNVVVVRVNWKTYAIRQMESSLGCFMFVRGVFRMLFCIKYPLMKLLHNLLNKNIINVTGFWKRFLNQFNKIHITAWVFLLPK